jgi:hypothetical protein
LVVNERGIEHSVSLLFKEGAFWYADGIKADPNSVSPITHWLEEQTNVVVCSLEELETLWDHAVTLPNEGCIDSWEDYLKSQGLNPL